MTLFVRVVHGFLESQSSDQAGTHSLIARLAARYPGMQSSEHTQDVFDQVPPSPPGTTEVTIDNSWAVAAAIRRADMNPTVNYPLLIGLDGITNPFGSPTGGVFKQDSGKEWVRRQNIGHLLYFREQDSILPGVPIRTGDLEMFTGQRNNAGGFFQYEYGWATECVLDKTQAFPTLQPHFEILTKHPFVEAMMYSAIDQTLAKAGA